MSNIIKNRYTLALMFYFIWSYVQPQVVPPFFQWILMTDIERNLDYIDIEVVSYKGNNFNPPKLYSFNRFTFGGRHPTLPKLFEEMAANIKSKNDVITNQIEKSIKQKLNDPNMIFNLVKIKGPSAKVFHTPEKYVLKITDLSSPPK